MTAPKLDDQQKKALDQEIAQAKAAIEALESPLRAKKADLSKLIDQRYAPEIHQLEGWAWAVVVFLASVLVAVCYWEFRLMFSSGQSPELKKDCLASLLAGVIGCATSALISALARRGEGWQFRDGTTHPGDDRKERFNRNMVLFLFGRPLLGLLAGLLVYTASMSGLLLKQEGSPAALPDTNRLIAYSLLAGLFAKSLIEKLKAVFDYVFGV